MARTRFIPDRGLTVRMATTMVLLALVYAAFVVALLWAGMPWWLVLLVVGGVALVQYFASDRIAMAALGAREVTPQQDPELHAVVDRLCALADMPKPKVAVAHTDVPNAFATGHSREAPWCASPPGCGAGSTTSNWKRCSPTNCPTWRTAT